jgi:hypothetical protein
LGDVLPPPLDELDYERLLDAVRAGEVPAQFNV